MGTRFLLLTIHLPGTSLSNLFRFCLKLPCLSPWRLLFLCFRYSIEVSNDNFDVSPFYLLQSCLELMVQIMFVFIFGIVCGCIHLDDGHFECQQSNQQSNLAVMTLSDTGSHSSSPVAASLLSRRPTPLLWLATFSPSPLGPENGKVSPVVSCVFPKFVHHISLTPMIASCDLLISLANCAVFPSWYRVHSRSDPILVFGGQQHPLY